MEARGGTGFLIVQRQCTVKHDVFQPTLPQWGAWLAYLKRIGYRTAFMQSRDFYTVPAEWPHLFDAEAQIGADHTAGEDYLAARRRENNTTFDTQRVIKNPHSIAVPFHSISHNPYQPFPRLWEAFADTPEILDCRSFATLAEASKRLAMRDKRAAEDYLNNRGLEGWTGRKAQPVSEPVAKDPPPQSSADLKTPSAPPSAALLKVLKARGYEFPKPPEDPDS
jgi:hypothetical protein